MKKYENVYKIMHYVYKKDRFTLQELMSEFNISKSTALRYIKALEDIGVPLYSELGRYGGYTILDTYKIPPLTFTPQETYALFFSLKAMEQMGSMPFQAEYAAIQQKFLDSVAPKIKASLEQLKDRVSFGSFKAMNDCPQLEAILLAVTRPSVLRIVYQAPKTAGSTTVRNIQPIGIFAEHGSWYCPAFDLDKKEYRLFRCDRIKELALLEKEPFHLIEQVDLHNRLQLVHKGSDTIAYRLEISLEGKEIYNRHHYPNMELEESEAGFAITGWINPSETDFLLHYLHQFAPYVLNVHPRSLKQAFIASLDKQRSKLIAQADDVKEEHNDAGRTI